MKKIMFSDAFGLTKAVLEGRKTITRRIIKSNDADSDYDVEIEYNAYMGDLLNIGVDGISCSNPSLEDFCISKYARYDIGEVVAVAQSYNDIYEELKRTHGSSSKITRDFFHKYIQGGRMPVSNKMFVKSEAMIHQIRISDIEVERLQDISESDAKNDSGCTEKNGCFFINGINTKFDTAKDAFQVLIDKLSGRGTYKSNPFVFVYSFELIK